MSDEHILDEFTGALATNQITLPAGNYYITAQAQCGRGNIKDRHTMTTHYATQTQDTAAAVTVGRAVLFNICLRH